VKITRMDGIECIKKFDSPDTFFYIDPPYVTSSGRIYRNSTDVAYLQRLIDTLKKIKGRFLLSLYYRDLQHLDIPPEWEIKKYRARLYVGFPSHDALASRYEVLVANYSLVGKIAERSEIASQFWKKNWWKCFPSSGKGRFVYHHHWRGLTEDEIHLSDDELMDTGHSIHGDLRLEFDSGLWGVSIFLGKASENKDGDKLIEGKEKLRCAFKPVQPKQWLEVGVDEPYVSEPGGVGSTSKKYSKFFAIDTGTYEIGVWREHFFEIFLHGSKLNGRYIISYAPVDGERIWLIMKPEDQTPYAEKYDKEEVIKELKEKGQKYLVWGKPGMKPELIILDDSVNKSFYGDFYSIEDEKHYVWAPFLIPDVIDAHGDFVRSDEIVKAVHRFTQTDMPVYYLHDEPLSKEQARVVECAVVHGDLIVNGKRFPPYTAVCGIAIDDDKIWNDIVTGKLTGVSIHAVVNKVDHGGFSELKNIRILHIGLADRPAVQQAVFQVMKTEVPKVSATNDIKSIIEDLKELYDSIGEDEERFKAPVATCIAILEGALAGVQYGYAYAYPEKAEKEAEEKTEEKVEEKQGVEKQDTVNDNTGGEEIAKAVSIINEIKRILIGR